MNILFVINSLEPGGAEVFVQRLCIALKKRNHKVYIMPMYAEKTNKEFASLFSKHTISILSRYTNPSRFKEWLFWKINAIAHLTGKLGMYSVLRDKDAEQYYKKLAKKYAINVIHSHLFSADYFAVSVLKQATGLPVITTLHGCYDQFLLPEFVEGNYINQVSTICEKIDYITYVAEKNIEIFQLPQITYRCPIEKVYLGYEKTETYPKLKFSSQEFVFGMVGRGIKEKGWKLAIEAFVALQKQHTSCKLILICPITPYIQELQHLYSTNSNIIFTGYVKNPEEYIQSFSIGLLPSYFSGESQPVVIAEMLSFTIPIIATNIGEIAEMLDAGNNKKAGFLLSRNTDGLPNTAELQTYMEQYICDDSLFQEHKSYAIQAAHKFSIDVCVQKFEAIYSKLVNENSIYIKYSK